jgi:alpha-glucosidase
MQDTLRYIPTGRDLSTQSISLEATHDNGVTELDAHSLFGHMSANVTSEFFTKTNKRPFVIERSAYTGTSRFASRWLGDNFSSEKFMGYSVTGVMAQSFNGYTLTGADVCGFMGNTNPELCARWYSVAAFQPFARNHNSWETMAQEPYQFDKDIYESTITYFDIIKHSMQARLNMIRYMYSSTMLDMVLGNGVYYQPLFFQFPADANAYLDQQNNVMLGKSLKLSVLSNAVGQDTHDFYFPAGTWCSMWQNIGEAACMTSTGQNVTMSSKAYNFYVHIRESSIVPIQNVTFLKDYYPETSFTSTADMQDQPVELHILPNSTDDASGDYYNDDGEVLTDQVGVFNIYQMVLSKNATDNSLVINITMPHTADNETYENSVINSNDVLGQIHLYNAKARGYDANNWQSEFHFRDNTVTELFIAQYEPMVNRVILPPTYVYLPSIDYIVLKPI